MVVASNTSARTYVTSICTKNITNIYYNTAKQDGGGHHTELASESSGGRQSCIAAWQRFVMSHAANRHKTWYITISGRVRPVCSLFLVVAPLTRIALLNIVLAYVSYPLLAS